MVQYRPHPEERAAGVRLEGWAPGAVLIPTKAGLLRARLKRGDFIVSHEAAVSKGGRERDLSSPLRQELNLPIVAADQRFLLDARPSLDLAFYGDSVRDVQEML